MSYDLITTLLNFPGFQVSDIRIGDRSAFRRVFVTIESLEGTHRFGECGKTGLPGYDHHEQEVRHLMWWQSFTVVRFRRYRVSCLDCGIRTEALDFVDLRGPRVTKPLPGLAYELCKVMTHKAVGILQGLHRGTVREIDKAMMEKVQSEKSLEGITVLGFDEIAVGKGQTYWTMISALEGPRGPGLLNIVEGRKEKSLLPLLGVVREGSGPSRHSRRHGYVDALSEEPSGPLSQRPGDFRQVPCDPSPPRGGQ